MAVPRRDESIDISPFTSELKNKIHIIERADEIQFYDAATDACAEAISLLEHVEARLVSKAVQNIGNDPLHSRYQRAQRTECAKRNRSKPSGLACSGFTAIRR